MSVPPEDKDFEIRPGRRRIDTEREGQRYRATYGEDESQGELVRYEIPTPAPRMTTSHPMSFQNADSQRYPVTTPQTTTSTLASRQHAGSSGHLSAGAWATVPNTIPKEYPYAPGNISTTPRSSTVRSRSRPNSHLTENLLAVDPQYPRAPGSFSATSLMVTSTPINHSTDTLLIARQSNKVSPKLTANEQSNDKRSLNPQAKVFTSDPRFKHSLRILNPSLGETTSTAVQPAKNKHHSYKVIQHIPPRRHRDEMRDIVVGDVIKVEYWIPSKTPGTPPYVWGQILGPGTNREGLLQSIAFQDAPLVPGHPIRY